MKMLGTQENLKLKCKLFVYILLNDMLVLAIKETW